MRAPPKQNMNVITASNPKMLGHGSLSTATRFRVIVISLPLFTTALVSSSHLLGTLIELALDGVARVSHFSCFQHFLQSVEIRIHLFCREFSNKSKCRAT